MPVDDCVICFQPLNAESQISVTPCGHVFHTHCIEEWQNQKKKERKPIPCPSCQVTYSAEQLIKKLFINFPDPSIEVINRDGIIQALQNDIETLKREKEEERAKHNKENEDHQKERVELRGTNAELGARVQSLTRSNDSLSQSQKGLREEVGKRKKAIERQKKEIEDQKASIKIKDSEIKDMKEKLQKRKRSEADEAKWAAAKKELSDKELELKNMKALLDASQNAYMDDRVKLDKMMDEQSKLQNQLNEVQDDLKATKQLLSTANHERRCMEKTLEEKYVQISKLQTLNECNTKSLYEAEDKLQNSRVELQETREEVRKNKEITELANSRLLRTQKELLESKDQLAAARKEWADLNEKLNYVLEKMKKVEARQSRNLIHKATGGFKKKCIKWRPFHF